VVITATAAATAPGFVRRRRAIEATGAEVMLVPAGRGGMIPPARILGALAKREVQLCLLEGGAGLHGAFVNAGLVDEVALFLAPELLGGGVPVCRGPGLASPLRLGPLRAIQIANDILVSADVVRDASPPRR
jgi:diaminohydroxyphosphoribosylaminopyrimidine deaminase/5-amino-6-(5-phosphoribosylamino)uracil reductase